VKLPLVVCADNAPVEAATVTDASYLVPGEATEAETAEEEGAHKPGTRKPITRKPANQEPAIRDEVSPKQ